MSDKGTTFTKEQMARLARYEHDLETAYRADYCSAVTSFEVREVREVVHQATGAEFPENTSCGACVLKLMKAAGRLYFQQKEQQKNQEQPKPKVQAQPKPKAKSKPKAKKK